MQSDDAFGKKPPREEAVSEHDRGPPKLDRMYAIAVGMSEWTAEEKEWLAENPRWLKYEARLRNAIREMEEEIARDSGSFAAREKKKRPDPPSIG